jgi:UPF0042 nucleotide-binding protein
MSKVKVKEKLEVVLYSFGFKHGQPENATSVWDVRFLPNPYWQEKMRDLTGLDSAVADYVIESEYGREFLYRLAAMLKFLIEQNRKADKDGMCIAIGCTGGQHRSVAVVEKLVGLLKNEGAKLIYYHRDIDKK